MMDPMQYNHGLQKLLLNHRLEKKMHQAPAVLKLLLQILQLANHQILK